jgi:hypothetical protein
VPMNTVPEVLPEVQKAAALLKTSADKISAILSDRRQKADDEYRAAEGAAMERRNAVNRELEPQQAQYDELMEAYNRLMNISPSRPSARTRAARPATRATATTPRRSGRREEFLAAIMAQPGEKIPFYARRIGASENGLYSIRERLIELGAIRMDADKALYPNASGIIDPAVPPATPITTDENIEQRTAELAAAGAVS